MTAKQVLIDEIKSDVITLLSDNLFNDDSMVEIYTKNALSFISTFCNRNFTAEEEFDEFPSNLKAPATDLVILKYRKNQSEGLDEEKAASVTLSYSKKNVPDYITKQLKKYRLVRFT